MGSDFIQKQSIEFDGIPTVLIFNKTRQAKWISMLKTNAVPLAQLNSNVSNNPMDGLQQEPNDWNQQKK